MTGSYHLRCVRKEVARSRKLPMTGKLSARPAGRPGDFLIAKESLQRSFPRHFLLAASNHTERSVCVFKARRNLSVRCGSERTKSEAGPTASRWLAPGPDKRTRREDHAPSHRPQMSSGRLFLDRVARQQSPSPLHQHPQINTHSSDTQAKDDISTLLGGRHFYFALTAPGTTVAEVLTIRYSVFGNI